MSSLAQIYQLDQRSDNVMSASSLSLPGQPRVRPLAAEERLVHDGSSTTTHYSVAINLLPGVFGHVDQRLINYFTEQIGPRLSFGDERKLLADCILGMSCRDTAIMHSVLLLACRCSLASGNRDPRGVALRRDYHRSAALIRVVHDAQLTIEPKLVHFLLLWLGFAADGSDINEWRYKIVDEMKGLLVDSMNRILQNALLQAIAEFLLYHEYSSSITSRRCSIDGRTHDLLAFFQRSQSPGLLYGATGQILSVMDEIRLLKDWIRPRRAMLDWCPLEDATIQNRAKILGDRVVTCLFGIEMHAPYFDTTMLYALCAKIYLWRTVHPSRPDDTLRGWWNTAMYFLKKLDSSVLLILVFILGCAAFQQHQRDEISSQLLRLKAWEKCNNVRRAEIILMEVWGLMDAEQEWDRERSWDWETLIHERGLEGFIIA